MKQWVMLSVSLFALGVCQAVPEQESIKHIAQSLLADDYDSADSDGDTPPASVTPAQKAMKGNPPGNDNMPNDNSSDTSDLNNDQDDIDNEED